VEKNRQLLIAAVCLLFPGIGRATQSFNIEPALVLPCGTDTLANYTTPGFSCTIGDKTFGSFLAVVSAVAASGTATPGNLGAITVVPGGDSTNQTFSFTADYLASGLGASDTLTVGYTGFAPANDPFTSATLSLTGASITGLAAIMAGESLCVNGSFTDLNLPLVCSSGLGTNLNLLSSITNANLNATITFNFDPATELGVVKEITLTGAASGTASASGLNNGLFATAVPEPASWFLVAIPLGLIQARRMNRKRTSSPNH
jgi:hypothetical protein